MAKFIELSLTEKKKSLINVETINEVWEYNGKVLVSTNQNEGSSYLESYEEVKLKIQNALQTL